MDTDEFKIDIHCSNSRSHHVANHVANHVPPCFTYWKPSETPWSTMAIPPGTAPAEAVSFTVCAFWATDWTFCLLPSPEENSLLESWRVPMHLENSWKTSGKQLPQRYFFVAGYSWLWNVGPWCPTSAKLVCTKSEALEMVLSVVSPKTLTAIFQDAPTQPSSQRWWVSDDPWIYTPLSINLRWSHTRPFETKKTVKFLGGFLPSGNSI